jgi:glycosyltransferase involved in cell wall biosynthesis
MVEKIACGREDIAFTFQLQSIFDTHVQGIPHFVYTDHTHLANLLDSQHMPVKLYSAEWISREKTIYLHADRIFTRSSDISRSLTEQYGISEEKIKCIYAGANTPPEEIDPDRKDYSARTILFVGLDWERKGGPDLLEAFRQIQPKYPDALLVIAGSQVKTDLENVVSLGRISVEELNRHYREATIFCLPSRNEPFGVLLWKPWNMLCRWWRRILERCRIWLCPGERLSDRTRRWACPGSGSGSVIERWPLAGPLRARKLENIERSI